MLEKLFEKQDGKMCCGKVSGRNSAGGCGVERSQKLYQSDLTNV
jgi:hypothetical protein